MNSHFDKISRRSLLAGGLGLGAVSLLPLIGTARAEGLAPGRVDLAAGAPPAEVDVLIIGAGAAGNRTTRDAFSNIRTFLNSTASLSVSSGFDRRTKSVPTAITSFSAAFHSAISGS